MTAELVLVAHLVNAAGVPEDMLRAIAAEARAIWLPAGTEISWEFTLRGDEMRHTRAELHVMVARACHHPVATPRLTPIGSIVFLDGQPTSRVCVSLDAANRLLDRDAAISSFSKRWPTPLRGRVLARMLGRAVAHEIGHYLFASADHSASGLMKATHSVADLTSEADEPFRVSAGGLVSRRE
jgi:hypothetical protein